MTSHALIPTTGEAVELSAPTEELAAFFDRIAEAKRELRQAEDLLKQELCGRLDRDNRRTDLFGEFEVSVDAPNPTEWDTAQLARVLTVLVGEGKLTADAARKVLEPVRVLKPRKRELDKLLGSPALTPYDREVLGQCERATGRPRRVKVTRK